MEKDLYQVLGLKRDASPQSIKKAYRKLAQQFHPDRYQNSGEEERQRVNERMLEITEAFRILADETERKAYDQKWAEEHQLAAVARGGGAAPPAAAPPRAGRPSEGRSKLGKDIATDFIAKLFAQLKTKGDGVQWKEEPSESRDWTRSLRCSEFGRVYFLQMYQTREATPSLARQFVRNAEAFVQSQKSLWRNTCFVFVLAFGKMSSTDEVMATCNRFLRIGKGGPVTEWRAVIVLLDTHNMRSVFSGRPIPLASLQRTFQVLQGKW